jgi:OmpA-OmpF porin, OOP family
MLGKARGMNTKLLAIVSLFSAFVLPLLGKDIPDGTDHPLIKRYEGSEIAWYAQKNYDTLRLALEPVIFNYSEQKFDPYKKLDVEGRKTTIYYRIPDGIGTLEAIRNYENELNEKGFEILFSAAGDNLERNRGDNVVTEIYGASPANLNPGHPDMLSLTQPDRSKSHYLAAKLSRSGEGDVYASVFAIDGSFAAATAFKIPEKTTLVRLDVCETKALEQKMVTVSATQMEKSISENGKVALYGIYFDFNKAEVKPESAPTLAEITKFMQSRPSLNLLVVGHTDSMGSFESNKVLSQRRAEAVVGALSGEGVEAKRLFPVGVSFAAPVATNGTEEGRAKNRRVELVEMQAAR